MLSDREAEEIERARRDRVGGPIVLKWIDQLLADRRERIEQLDHLRKRLNQAFRYLDGLVRDVQHPQAPPEAPSMAAQPACPSCGKPYVRASGLSPRGMIYFHDGRSECRTR
jgi:hypothetical protein